MDMNPLEKSQVDLFLSKPSIKIKWSLIHLYKHIFMDKVTCIKSFLNDHMSLMMMIKQSNMSN